MGLKPKRESPSRGLPVGGGLMCYKQWELYLGARFSLLGLFDLFDLAGFVHHFPVDHGLSDHLDDLPGANIRLFYRETVRVSPYCEGDTERDYYCYFFFLYTWTCKVCVAKDALLCFATLLCLWRLICHYSAATASVSRLAAMRRACVPYTLSALFVPDKELR